MINFKTTLPAAQSDLARESITDQYPLDIRTAPAVWKSRLPSAMRNAFLLRLLSGEISVKHDQVLAG